MIKQDPAGMLMSVSETVGELLSCGRSGGVVRVLGHAESEGEEGACYMYASVLPKVRKDGA